MWTVVKKKKSLISVGLQERTFKCVNAAAISCQSAQSPPVFPPLSFSLSINTCYFDLPQWLFASVSMC